ncbi:hypothetical protein AB0H83_23325 [Dactylosporangium sp. NPDC050688]|uniref:hypothetical protein n=1 Tax=Dactylosporangium sp. NPDC050688 TaxID=3157217 RepID=UPI003408D1B4
MVHLKPIETHGADPGGTFASDDATSAGRHAAPDTPTELVNLAGARLAAYDFTGAYQLLIEVRSRIEHGVPVDHVDAVDATRMLAETMLALGQADQAADVLADLATWPDFGPYQSAMHALTEARLLAAQHRLDDATACYRDIIDRSRGAREPIRWPVLLATAGAASLTAAQGRPATAEPALTQAYTCLVDEYGFDHTDVIRVGVDLAELRIQLGGHDAAWQLAAQLTPAARARLGGQHPLVTQLNNLRNRLTAAHPDDEPRPAVTSNRPAAPRSAGPNSKPGRREPGRQSLRHWTLVGVVVCLAAASATAVSVAVIAKLVPAGEPERNRAQPTVPAATRTPWTLASHDTSQLRPPADVRIVRDTGTTIDITWTDPSGGTRPTIVFLAQDNAPASVAATVQAAATRRQLTGLDPKARRYCVGVAVAYSPTAIARAADVCTTRAPASPIQATTARRSLLRSATAAPPCDRTHP